MASPSAAGSSRDTTAPPPVAGDAPVDTAQLDRLVEKALTADKNCRYTLAASFYRRALPPEETFVSTFLTLQRASSLRCQLHLEGVTPDERAALDAEAWALASSCLPLIVRRMTNRYWMLFSPYSSLIFATMDSQLYTRLVFRAICVF